MHAAKRQSFASLIRGTAATLHNCLRRAGVLMAVVALDQRASAAVLGLRGLNPHVAAALGDWRKRSNLRAAVPRQGAPAAAVDVRAAAAGASSFGMGGTNAHLLAGVAAGSLAGAPRPAIAWQRTRRAFV